MTGATDLRAEGCARFAERCWRQAADLLARADAEQPLDAEGLEQLATAMFLAGHDEPSDRAWVRAHRLRLQHSDLPGSTRCAFWLAFRLLNAGDLPQASGWIARIEELLRDEPSSPVEEARLAYLTGLRALFSGDPPAAEVDLARADTAADEGGDLDLRTLARLARGRGLVLRGDVVGGIRLIDEAMVALATGGLSPIVVGDSYCTALDACQELVDVRRGQTWTARLEQWCEEQRELVPYAGLCLVHRAEFLRLKGDWVQAMAQIGLARRRLSSPAVQQALGAALYQQGELHRLRGEHDAAEASYRQASAHGHDPQPGLALLRLAQREVDNAAHALGRALAEAEGPTARSPLLQGYAEVMLATGDLAAARVAVEELGGIASAFASPMLQATAERCAAALALADGDPQSALRLLKRAGAAFRSLDVPYEIARAAVLVAEARAALGDDEGARLEREAAVETFRRLGAATEVARLDPESAPTRLLTAREEQILRLVATGATNRAIGAELGLSERTVDRHLSNILAKLDVPSRAAATARALEDGLL